jgi:hypothetical protein
MGMTPERLYRIIKATNWEYLDSLHIQQLADLSDSDYVQIARMLLEDSENRLRRAGYVLCIMRPLLDLCTIVLHSVLAATDLSLISVGASALLQVRSSDDIARDLLAVLDQQPTDAMLVAVFELFAWIGVTYNTLCSPRGADIVFTSRLRPLWRDRTIPSVRYTYLDNIALRVTTHLLDALEQSHQGELLKQILISLYYMHELDDYPEPIRDRVAHIIGYKEQFGDILPDLRDDPRRRYESPYGSMDTQRWVWTWSLSSVYGAIIHDLIHWYQKLRARIEWIAILDEQRIEYELPLENLQSHIKALQGLSKLLDGYNTYIKIVWDEGFVARIGKECLS